MHTRPHSRKLKCSYVAIELYRKLVACGDLRASHKLATLVDEGKSALYGDPEYARKVFDQLSDVFHQRITEQLGYRIPWLLEEQVSKALELRGDDCTHAKSYRILDLGSGSGLCGETFRSYVTIYDQDDVQTSSGSSNITGVIMSLSTCPPLFRIDKESCVGRMRQLFRS